MTFTLSKLVEILKGDGFTDSEINQFIKDFKNFDEEDLKSVERWSKMSNKEKQEYIDFEFNEI